MEGVLLMGFPRAQDRTGEKAGGGVAVVVVVVGVSHCVFLEPEIGILAPDRHVTSCFTDTFSFLLGCNGGVGKQKQ